MSYFPPGLRLLLWSLVVALAALSSVAFFADRVHRALLNEGAATLAADLVVEQLRPVPPDWVAQARSRGLAVSQLVSFPSVLFVNDRPQLVQVKAVQENYPLRGNLRIAQAGNPPRLRPPGGGEAVVAPRLALALQGGASIPLGEQSLSVIGELLEEPDVGANLFQLAPRLLVSWEDAQRSGLLGPASRARHRLLVAGEPAQVADFRAWIKPNLPSSAQLLEVSGGRPELDTAIQRGQRFLSLAALCASLLAGVAIMLATRRFVERTLDQAAVLRTLGMTGNQVLWRFLRQLLGVTGAAVVIGVAIGYVAQWLLAAWFADWLGGELPPAGWRPVGVAALHALVLVTGFALPSLLAIRRVPPLRVLRRELDPPGMPQWLSVLLALAAYTAAVYWQVDDVELATGMSLGLVSVLGVFGVAAWLLLRLLRPLRHRGTLAVGLAALSRQPGLTLMQLAGFGLGITLLLLLALVRVDILEAWEATLPADAPNYFLLNIQPDEVQPIRQRFDQQGVRGSGFHPTTRARLLAINGREVKPEDYQGARARRLASREYSLGFGDALQVDNRLLAGRWWRPGEPGFSVEGDFADQLGLKPGDRLRFDVAGQAFEAPVLSVRSVAWDSFNVNFFVQASPALLQGLPHAVLTSLYLPDNRRDLLRELVADYPALSVIGIQPLIDKVRGVIRRGALAIEGVFLFTLAAAVLVGVAAVQISREQRAGEIALLRTLGASHRRVMRLVLSEFLVLGLLAGVLAALLSNLLSVLLSQRLFDLHTGFSPLLWLVGSGLGVGVVGLLGYLASRPLLRTPPMQLLR